MKDLLKQRHIEAPGWGYANSGTRFKAFAWPGAATTTSEKRDGPLLAQVRAEMGVPVDPVAAYKASGCAEKIQKERGLSTPSGGFQ